MFIVDAAGAAAYECEGAFLSDGPWSLRRADGASATVRRDNRRRWTVHTPHGVWTLESRFRWFAKEFNVAGGPFDGARLAGSTFTRKFTITQGGATLARVDGNISYAQDEHRVTLLADGDEAEWLAVSAAVVLIQQQKDDSAN